MKKFIVLFLLSISSSLSAYAGEIKTTVYDTSADHKPVGEVTFKDTPYGLLITPHLTNLPQGLHGFHIHEKPNCSNGGIAAGGHYDPKNTNTHLGPYANGHLGDLPALYVSQQGKANVPILAPRLKTSDLSDKALMIHAGGDTYSDSPHLGGGGDRIACGVID